MALFAGRKPGEKDNYYFPISPSNVEARLISQYKAVPCAKPLAGEAILICGNEQSSDLLM